MPAWIDKWQVSLQGFLSARLTLPQLISFGLSLFTHASNGTKANLMVKGLPGLLSMLVRLSHSVGHTPPDPPGRIMHPQNSIRR